MDDVCKGKFCPMAGALCPGQDQCAPAVMQAYGRVDEVNIPIAPYCPLVAAIDAIVASAIYAEQLVRAQVKVPQLEPTPDDADRDKVIAGLKIDQVL